MMKDLAKKTGFQWMVFTLATLIASTWVIDKAQAIPVLSLQTGSSTLTISDNSAGDSDLSSGVITSSTSIGNFIINISTGVTKPVLGSPSAPHLSLTSVHLASQGPGGFLTIAFTDTDFTTLNPGSTFLSSIGGPSTTGTITYSSFLDSSNTPFGIATSLGNQNFVPGIISGTFSSSNFPSAFPYSLTQIIGQNLPGSGIASFSADLQAVAAVPEPASLILLGIGLIGLAAWRQCKIAKR